MGHRCQPLTRMVHSGAELLGFQTAGLSNDTEGLAQEQSLRLQQLAGIGDILDSASHRCGVG